MQPLLCSERDLRICLAAGFIDLSRMCRSRHLPRVVTRRSGTLAVLLGIGCTRVPKVQSASCPYRFLADCDFSEVFFSEISLLLGIPRSHGPCAISVFFTLDLEVVSATQP